MQVIRLVISLLLVLFLQSSSSAQVAGPREPDRTIYKVKRLKKPMTINADWNKSQWKSAPALDINNFIREDPEYRPVTKAKMMYDSDNLYVIFFVKDKYVRSVTTDINGQVWKDSAVEFFFAPDSSNPVSYFNLEVNCGGTPLFGYNTTPKIKPDLEDIKTIEIAHSLPETVDPEIKDFVNWSIEYRIPLSVLRKYGTITDPERGVQWRANFYKIAEINFNPHHASWSVINHPRPTFHLPQFFGILAFQ